MRVNGVQVNSDEGFIGLTWRVGRVRVTEPSHSDNNASDVLLIPKITDTSQV